MRRRRIVVIVFLLVVIVGLAGARLPLLVGEMIPLPEPITGTSSSQDKDDPNLALTSLNHLPVKGRAPKTGYERSQFGEGWAKVNGCTTREIILYRDLKGVTLEDKCTITAGTLNDPYTGKTIAYSKQKAAGVQIDHVVALSDAWQKGAQQLTKGQRQQLANDPLELLAVDGLANQQKSDGDAATWLPKNKAFRCDYVARQIAVKQKYALWVTEAEKEAIKKTLVSCTGEKLPAS